MQRVVVVAVFILGSGAGLSACSDDDQALVSQSIERPSAITFACYGELRITSSETGAASDPIVASAQPLSACQARLQSTGSGESARPADPPGQGAIGSSAPDDPSFYSFVLQQDSGSMAVVRTAIGVGETVSLVLDADPLAPGKNAVVIGSLPVDLITSPSGCHVVAANAGSCDLSVIDVASAVDPRVLPVVERRTVRAAGQPLFARPRAMVGSPAAGEVGVECPATAQGLAYVAYPGCSSVAVVDIATGDVVGGVAFGDDGTVELTAELACENECGDAAVPIAFAGQVDTTGPERPVTVTLDDSGQRLFIGSENRPGLTIVELDTAGLPVSSQRVELEGRVGIEQVHLSPVVAMGGSITSTTSAGEFQFVYALATDGTIRVIEVRTLLAECDTQVDPRYLTGIRDAAQLACLPVGGEQTPPRRALASSPGIRLPGDAVPLDLAFVTLDLSDNPARDVNGDTEVDADDNLAAAPPQAGIFVGTFAYATSSAGGVVVINVDDDRYPDFETPAEPLQAYWSLALPHQVRDAGADRSMLSFDGEKRLCTYPTSAELGPHLATAPQRVRSIDLVDELNELALPSLHAQECLPDGDGGERIPLAVPDLAYQADAAVRAAAYPDLAAVPREQEWVLTWEGTISLDDAARNVDGPQVRAGFVSRQLADTVIEDPSSPFCNMGARPFDILQLLGCDPNQGDAQCGLGQTCYVDPLATVASGLCLPSGRADALAAGCGDVLTTRRRYTVREVFPDRLVLGERRRVLRTTPIGGCQSEAQCTQLAAVEAALADPEQRNDDEFAWTCAADPTRATSSDTCLMTCEATADCEDGWACSGGFCVEGVLPRPECVETLQRYAVRAGEAFAVIGSVQGFLHDTVVDPVTGTCVDDPNGSSLLTSRLPLEAPSCEDLGPIPTPNPCMTTVAQAEQAPALPGGMCPDDPDEPVPSEFRVRQDVPALRYENPSLQLTLVDPYTTAEAVCPRPEPAELPPFRTVYPGYRISFNVVGGFLPMVSGLTAVLPVAIERGPDNRLWILDAGDLEAGRASAAGGVYRLNPAIPQVSPPALR